MPQNAPLGTSSGALFSLSRLFILFIKDENALRVATMRLVNIRMQSTKPQKILIIMAVNRCYT